MIINNLNKILLIITQRSSVTFNDDIQFSYIDDLPPSVTDFLE